MKAILIVLATLFTFQLQAADVTVTAEDAFPPTLTGSISVDINPQLGNAPFVITVTSPHSSFSHSENVSQYSWSLGNLPPGKYCVQIISNDGCVANVCIRIHRCNQAGETIACLHTATSCCEEQVLVAGIPEEDSGLGTNTDKYDFFYQWYTQIDSFFTTSISADLQDSAFMVVDYLLLNGYTPYDTASQSEIDNPDAVFIISFDPGTKEIQWVWHNLPIQQNRIIPQTRDDADQGQVNIYPNPTKKSLNAQWPAGKYSYVSTINMLGQEVLRTPLDSDADFKTFDFDESFPSGIYIMKWHTVEGDYTSKRFILQR